MSDYMTHEEVYHVIIEGIVHFPFLVLKNIHWSLTFTTAHVNDFSQIGSVRSWEDHDWSDWTLMVGTTQVIGTRILIEQDTTRPPEAEWYFVLAQDEDKDVK